MCRRVATRVFTTGPLAKMRQVNLNSSSKTWCVLNINLIATLFYFYDPWVGSLDGLVPPPPSSLFEGNEWREMCMGNVASTRKGFIYGETAHLRRSRNHIAKDAGRLLLSGSDSLHVSSNNTSIHASCLEACLPAKCCFAPDPSSMDVVLSPDGFYTDAVTGEKGCWRDDSSISS